MTVWHPVRLISSLQGGQEVQQTPSKVKGVMGDFGGRTATPGSGNVFQGGQRAAEAFFFFSPFVAVLITPHRALLLAAEMKQDITLYRGSVKRRAAALHQGHFWSSTLRKGSCCEGFLTTAVVLAGRTLDILH